MFSCSPPSGLLGGQGPLLKSIEPNGLIMGQVGTPRCLPWGGQVWHCPLQDWICCIMLHHVQCSLVQGLGTPWWGAFHGPWHPLCCVSHGCPVEVAFLGYLAPQLGKSAEQMMGVHCLWLEVMPHLQNLSSSPLWCRVCASLAADKPRTITSTLKLLDIPAMDASSSSLIHHFPDALNSSVTFLISIR